MNAAEYASGLLLLGVVAAGFWSTAGFAAGRLLAGWAGAPALLGRIVLALSVAIVTLELLGVVAALSAPAIAVAAIAPAAALRLIAARSEPAEGPRGRREERLPLALAVAASTLTAIRWAGPTLRSLDIGIYREDSIWYHLPFAAWFAQTGSITGLLRTDPSKLIVWFYPLDSELLQGGGMVLLGNDLLAPVFNFGWMGLALLAAWCVGRPTGRAATTLLGAIVVVGADLMLNQAGDAASDIAGLACLLAAVAILVEGASAGPDPGPRPDGTGNGIDSGPLAVAGLAAGLAIGTKVTLLVPVAVITAYVLLGDGRRSRRRAGIWLGGLFVTGGFWYLRNLAQAGNPLPWIHLGPLGGPAQQGDYPRPAHAISEYLADHQVWTGYFLPGLHQALGPLWFVAVFAALAGIVLDLRGGGLRRALAIAAGAAAVAYVLIPISAAGSLGAPYGFVANLRYGAPALVLGLVLLPLSQSRRTVRSVLAPAYALTIAAMAIASTEWDQPRPAIVIVIGAGAVLGSLWLVAGPPGRHRGLVLAAAIGAIVIAGYPQQRQYFAGRYRVDLAGAADQPGFRATGQWRRIQAWARSQTGLKIGVVGSPGAFAQYVFDGADLSNEVRYVGEPIARGGLITIRSCQRWRRLVNAGGYNAIVVTPEDLGTAQSPAQIAWTGTDPDARTILDRPPAAVFRLAGPLDPSGCAAAEAARAPGAGRTGNPFRRRFGD